MSFVFKNKVIVFAVTILFCSSFIFSTLPAEATSLKSNAEIIKNDSQVKKYDTQLQKLEAKLRALQEEYMSVYNLRTERLKAITPNTSSVQTPTRTNEKILSELPSAGATWRQRFKPASIPTNSFQAYYFNSKNPDTVIKQEIVQNVGMSYVWDSGPGFKVVSEDFGGYWIGNFSLNKEEMMSLSISQSWSEIRVIIDGKVLYSGGDGGTYRVKIPAGTHTLEVEYVNNWHTVDFSVTLKSESSLPKKITPEATKALKADEMWFASVYESGSADRTIKLLPSKNINKKKKVLVLSSYEPIVWDAGQLKDAQLTTIVTSSYKSGSVVKNVPPGVLVYELDRIPYVYELKANCDVKPGNGIFYCSGLDDFSNAYNTITKEFKLPLTGFAGAYSAESLTLPSTVLTPSLIKELLEYPQEVQKSAEEYIEKQSLKNIFR